MDRHQQASRAAAVSGIAALARRFRETVPWSEHPGGFVTELTQEPLPENGYYRIKLIVECEPPPAAAVAPEEPPPEQSPTIPPADLLVPRTPPQSPQLINSRLRLDL